VNRLADTLKKLPGVDDEIAGNLIAAGLRTIKQVNRASEDELKAIKGLGATKARAIKEHLKKAAERKPKKG
jgi:ERCC4-type nuclease